MGTIKFLALGAGQDVGRSCILVTMSGRTIMFDCGMHMGYQDERRFPDFSQLAPPGPNQGETLTQLIDCVVITHFHLDHCGALPYLTEICGYRGPIYMTAPTLALCPLLLEDFRRIAANERRASETSPSSLSNSLMPGEIFSADMIKACMARVQALPLDQVHVLERPSTIGFALELRPYYAGHVLGAAMFWARVGAESVVYTGDYNMTPDRHLGSAWLELRLRPDLFITESTYATTLRESKRARERDFLRMVHGAVAEGGKVLIPVFALGRVQELAILVEEYWQRMGLDHIPVYFSAGMAESALTHYQIHLSWTNEKLKEEAKLAGRNPFAFRYVRPFERHFADHPGPMVLFSSPGMLHSGTSLEIFKKWCGEARNLLIIPGFCVSGTVGARLLAGQRKIVLDEFNSEGQVIRRTYDVRMQVRNMSFSAHADARGIMQLIRICEPRNVVLVHGEAAKMAILREQIIKEMGIPCFDPANGEELKVESGWLDPVTFDVEALVERQRREIELIAQTLQKVKDDDDDQNVDESDEDLSPSLEALIKARARSEVCVTGYLTYQSIQVEKTKQKKQRKKQKISSPQIQNQQLSIDSPFEELFNHVNHSGEEDYEEEEEDDGNDNALLHASMEQSISPSLLIPLQRHLAGDAQLVNFYEELGALRVKSFVLNMANGQFQFQKRDYQLADKIVQFLFSANKT